MKHGGFRNSEKANINKGVVLVFVIVIMFNLAAIISCMLIVRFVGKTLIEPGKRLKGSGIVKVSG